MNFTFLSLILTATNRVAVRVRNGGTKSFEFVVVVVAIGDQPSSKLR